MRANPENFKFLILLQTQKKIFKVTLVEWSFLTVNAKMDNYLSFKSIVKSLCKNASQKINTFIRTACFLKFGERKILLNAFMKSQFSYRCFTTKNKITV